MNRKLTKWQPPPQIEPDSEEEMDINAVCPSKSVIRPPTYAEIIKRPPPETKIPQLRGQMRPATIK